jgi:hypothetical protein
LAAQRQALKDAPAAAAQLRALAGAYPQNRPLALIAAEAALLAGDFRAVSGDAAAARSDWGWAKQVLDRPATMLTSGGWTPSLLLQANYRLSAGRPPTGPVLAGDPAPVQPRAADNRALADYRW